MLFLFLLTSWILFLASSLWLTLMYEPKGLELDYYPQAHKSNLAPGSGTSWLVLFCNNPWPRHTSHKTFKKEDKNLICPLHKVFNIMFYIRIFKEIRKYSKKRKCSWYISHKRKVKIQNNGYNIDSLRKSVCHTHVHTDTYILL